MGALIVDIYESNGAHVRNLQNNQAFQDLWRQFIQHINNFLAT
jgi:hypothetical protein